MPTSPRTETGARGTYASVHALRHVNASQSTADVCHSAVRAAAALCLRGLELDETRCRELAS